MIKKLFITLLILTFSSTAHAAVLWETNLDSNPDWTVAQPTGSDSYCYNFYGVNCGLIPDGFDGFYNGANFCDGSVDEPGNNNFYINSSPGYPDETGNTSRGGSGKSITYWQESCDAVFHNSDGQLSKLLATGQSEIYVRFYIRFKPNFELKETGETGAFQFKLFHIQSYSTGSPHDYFESGEVGNRPIISGGIKSYGQNLQLYAAARCVGTYTCYNAILWPISTITEARQSGGIFDGGWHCLEFYGKLNSEIGIGDGVVNAYLDGNLMTYLTGYEGDEVEFNDSIETGVQKFRYITIGGNAYNQWDTDCTNTADCEQWYSIDDIVVASDYIGTDYVIGGATYTPPTISGPDDFSTTSTSVEIEGTYTNDPDLADQSVVATWTLGEDSGFCVAVLGVFSCAVPVELGANSVVFQVVDSNAGEDLDTTVVTRTLPFTLKTHGNINFKNATLH